MGNCHTVGPNEALVVSGNVTDRERCVSVPRVPSCLVELDEGFTWKIKKEMAKATFARCWSYRYYLIEMFIWADDRG